MHNASILRCQKLRIGVSSTFDHFFMQQKRMRHSLDLQVSLSSLTFRPVLTKNPQLLSTVVFVVVET